MTEKTSWLGSWRTLLQALWLTMLASLLVACGGAMEAAKQQVEISVSVPAEVTIAPGGQLSVSASAIARDEPLTAMSWSIEPVTTPAPVSSTSTPSIVNGSCANKTLTLEGNDGKGRCAVTITVPDQTQPTSWKIMASATGTKKGSASKSFLLHVRNPEVDNGNFKVVTQPMVQARSNEITTLTAIGNADQTISKLQYRWVQHLDDGQTPLYLAGENSNELRFVPIEVKDLRFTVTATGEINGKLESASADVLVLVGLPTKQVVVTITEPGEQNAVNQRVTLEGTATLNGAPLPANAEYRWQLISPKDSELVEPPVLNNMNSEKMNFWPKQQGTYVFKLTVTVLINGQYYTGESITERVVAPERETCGFKVECTIPGSTGTTAAEIEAEQSVTFEAVSSAETSGNTCMGKDSINSVSYKWTSSPKIDGIDSATTSVVSGSPKNPGDYVIIVTATPTINGYTIAAAGTANCILKVNEKAKPIDLVIDIKNTELKINTEINLTVDLSRTTPEVSGASGATYKWRQLSGISVSFTTSNGVLTFKPTVAGVYEFDVEVSDAKTADGKVFPAKTKKISITVS